jgi:hypothetical protein
VVLEFGSGVVSQQWTTSIIRKKKGRDLAVCFNVILLYVEVSVVKGIIF